jgi:aspartyl/asparaginyl beta-hydroxylase (cupin superfamily)
MGVVQKDHVAGQVVVFDDSFLHCSRSNSFDDAQVVLVVDLWHPRYNTIGNHYVRM